MRRPVVRAERAVFLLALGFFLLFARGRFFSTDEVIVYQVTQALWERGSFAVGIVDQAEAPASRGGGHYAQYGSAQSMAALPLYGLGRAVDALLPADSAARRALGGSRLSRPGVLWGGDIEIFFVSLFNAFVSAAACSAFYLLLLRTGIGHGWALGFALLLAGCSYFGVIATTFYQHPSEALLSICAVILALDDGVEPQLRRRIGIGALACAMLLVRPPAAFALPGILGLHALLVARRVHGPPPRRISRLAQQLLPSVAGALTGLGLVLLEQRLKSGGAPWGYGAQSFATPLSTGALAYLTSPGLGIFFYAPLLVLSLIGLPSLALAQPVLASFLCLHLASYLIGYGSYQAWHGMFCFGPRYLSPLIPFLLLPAAHLCQQQGRRVLIALLPLALAGFWVELSGLLVDPWFAALRAGYVAVQPMGSFLLSWNDPPLLEHARALLSFDDRVVFFLRTAALAGGPAAVMLAVCPPAACLFAGLFILARKTRSPELVDPLQRHRRGALVAAAVLLVLGLWRFVDTRPPPGVAGGNAAAVDAAWMRAGNAALYGRRSPAEAEPIFRRVLRRATHHYGAANQLALALDRQSRADEAEPIWRDVLTMAQAYGDTSAIATARHRLETPAVH